MTKSTRFIITAAAMAGLYAGSFAVNLRAADSAAGTPATKDVAAKNSCSGKHGCNGQSQAKSQKQAPDPGKSDMKKDTAKSSCSGKNGCSGKAGK